MDNTVFAYRVLRKSDGARCLAKIFAPIEGDVNWSCRVEIEGSELAVNTAYGIDSLQALKAGIIMLIAELKSLEATNPKDYTWEDEDCLTIGL